MTRLASSLYYYEADHGFESWVIMVLGCLALMFNLKIDMIMPSDVEPILHTENIPWPLPHIAS
jgi:hypothetical protein